MIPEQILDEAISKVLRGDQSGLDDLLSAYPQARSDVEPLLKVAQQLASVPPAEAPQTFVAATRQQLIAQAAVRHAAPQRERNPRRFSFPIRFRKPARRLTYAAMALTVVLALTLGGGGVAAASSLPGQSLYGVKRVTEDAPLLVLSNAIVRADYQLTLLDRRIDEVESLGQLGALNSVALTELRMATSSAVAAVQAVPLERSADHWARLETAVTQQGRMLDQLAREGQVPVTIEDTFAHTWQICANAQAKARATLSTLSSKTRATAIAGEGPG